MGRRTTMTDGTIERVSVFDGWTVDDLEDARPTIREAIDYAISLHNKDISTTSPSNEDEFFICLNRLILLLMFISIRIPYDENRPVLSGMITGAGLLCLVLFFFG